MREDALSPLWRLIVVIIIAGLLAVHGFIWAVFGYRWLAKFNRKSFPAVWFAAIAVGSFLQLKPYEWDFNEAVYGGMAAVVYVVIFAVFHFLPQKAGLFIMSGGLFGIVAGTYIIGSTAILGYYIDPNHALDPKIPWPYFCGLGVLIVLTVIFGVLGIRRPRQIITFTSVISGSVLVAATSTYVVLISIRNWANWDSAPSYITYLLPTVLPVLAFFIVLLIGLAAQSLYREKGNASPYDDGHKIPLLDSINSY